MKRLIFLFALLPLLAQGQRLDRLPPASEVDKAYRAEYRATLRAYERQAAQLRQDGYDIVLDDLEQVPTAVSIAATTQRNWGETLLIPDALRQRVAQECTRPVVIKVADTGGKFTHNDLIFGQLPGKSYTGEATPEDKNGHATHVAGIIAGKGIGLAWQMVEKMRLRFKPIKVLSDAGGGSFTWVANAFATERTEDKALIAGGTAVIYSGSFGGGTSIIPAVEKELQASTEAGVFFVFAAGNTGGPVNYPAMSPYAITVASLDQSMVVSSFSSRGPEVDNAMPGRNINSTYKDGAYATLSGTSMATPFLSAACAIALSKWGMERIPNTAAMKAYLAKVATDIPPPGRDDPSGWGAVFIRAILDTAPDGGAPPPPPPPPPVGKVAGATSTGGYVMRYSYEGETVQRLLQVVRVELYVEAETAEKSIEAARDYCNRYFPSHQIAGIPKQDGPEGGLIGAGYWTGQFLEFFGKNNGANLQVTKVICRDEVGREFEVMGFDRADMPEDYDTRRPKLISN